MTKQNNIFIWEIFIVLLVTTLWSQMGNASGGWVGNSPAQMLYNSGDTGSALRQQAQSQVDVSFVNSRQDDGKEAFTGFNYEYGMTDELTLGILSARYRLHGGQGHASELVALGGADGYFNEHSDTTLMPYVGLMYAYTMDQMRFFILPRQVQIVDSVNRSNNQSFFDMNVGMTYRITKRLTVSLSFKTKTFDGNRKRGSKATALPGEGEGFKLEANYALDDHWSVLASATEDQSVIGVGYVW